MAVKPIVALLFAIAVGAQAPDFKLLDQNRKPVSLAGARGHKAVLVFYRGYW
jgi:peroxiredoxin